MWKGFVAGLVVANAFEWVAHKYILHGTHRAGKPRYSPVPDSMKSHWEHHREVRKTTFHDQVMLKVGATGVPKMKSCHLLSWRGYLGHYFILSPKA